MVEWGPTRRMSRTNNHLIADLYINYTYFVDMLLEQNLDLANIVTPVYADQLEIILNQARYDRIKTNFLVQGFRTGFSLGYQGPKKVRRFAPNLKLTIGSKLDIWNKVMVEVQAGRYAGPFDRPPFKYFIQSPIGLVPKDKGKKTRLIFHLSYPKDGESVNSGIPDELCSVKYPDFQQAVEICLRSGKGCHVAKSDMARAFRNVPMNKQSWKYLILKAQHPVTGKVFYFVDKCLPFGSSISCAIFQEFSNAIAFVVSHRTQAPLVNYLDDYMFAALMKAACDGQVHVFLDICERIGFPVSLEKTVWGSTWMIFLGLLLDTENQRVCIPVDKVDRAIDMIEYFLNKENKKVTVHQIQKLCGFLNFLCKCIVPGRVFLRRLYSTIAKPGLKQHHHVRITQENKQDLEIWRRFLRSPEVFAIPFIELGVIEAEDIDMYSDASGSMKKGGFGAYCGESWTAGKWDPIFMARCKPSIEFLELYALTVGVVLWIDRFKNRAINLFCDNTSVKNMVNKTVSGCKNCMVLLRVIVLYGLVHNVKIRVKYVSTKDNAKADALSRSQWKRFKDLGSRHELGIYPCA